MKKKFKIPAFMIAFVLSVTLFAGCVKPVQPGDPTPPPQPPGPVDPVTPEPPGDDDEPPEIEGLTLTFSDEFKGDALDLRNWDFMLGTGGGHNYWGNNEKQYYTEGDNVTVSGGTMKIAAKREDLVYQRIRTANSWDNDKTIWWAEDEDGEPLLDENGNPYQMEKMEFTSTRMRTAGRFYQKYGRFEAKIRLPAVQGMWPAFWMMPEQNVYGGWPRSGEIDIMEARGRVPEKAGHALHFGTGAGGGHRYFAYPNDYTLRQEKLDGDGNAVLGDDGKAVTENGTIEEYHVYRVDWYEDRFEWYIDDVLTYVIVGDSEAKADYAGVAALNPGLRINGEMWTTNNYASQPGRGERYAPFDQEFHMILNLAVGGHFDGNRMPPEDFAEAVMEVDYVRVYQFDEYLYLTEEAEDAENGDGDYHTLAPLSYVRKR